MYVCCCFAVPEATVDAVIENGAHSVQAVTRACRAGGDCGACHGMIEQKIADHLEDAELEMSGPQLVSAGSLASSAARVRAA